MSKDRKPELGAYRLGLAMIALAAGSHAFAQTQPLPDPGAQTPATSPPASQQGEVQEEEEIVVTGSYIQGASDTGAVAVTTIDSDQIETLGATSAGEVFEYIAQAGSAEINSGADGPNDARGDIATVNLRGLGTGNTLILLNGRRLAAHAVNQDVGDTPRQVTNVNAFPTMGIDRVEVLRDGASALYGADATAGVVNTILDARQNGGRLSARFSDWERTAGGEQTIEGSYGFEFGSRTRGSAAEPVCLLARAPSSVRGSLPANLAGNSQQWTSGCFSEIHHTPLRTWTFGTHRPLRPLVNSKPVGSA